MKFIIEIKCISFVLCNSVIKLFYYYSNGKSTGQPMAYLCRHRREAKVYLQSIRHSALGRKWVVSTTLRPFYPSKNPVFLVQVTGWHYVTVWTARKIPSISGFDFRTFQPMASLYADIVITAASVQMNFSF